jgi:hypothetical protein
VTLSIPLASLRPAIEGGVYVAESFEAIGQIAAEEQIGGALEKERFAFSTGEIIRLQRSFRVARSELESRHLHASSEYDRALRSRGWIAVARLAEDPHTFLQMWTRFAESAQPLECRG